VPERAAGYAVCPWAIVLAPSLNRISTLPRSITRATTPSPNFGYRTSSPGRCPAREAPRPQPPNAHAPLHGARRPPCWPTRSSGRCRIARTLACCRLPAAARAEGLTALRPSLRRVEACAQALRHHPEAAPTQPHSPLAPSGGGRGAGVKAFATGRCLSSRSRTSTGQPLRGVRGQHPCVEAPSRGSRGDSPWARIAARGSAGAQGLCGWSLGSQVMGEEPAFAPPG